MKHRWSKRNRVDRNRKDFVRDSSGIESDGELHESEIFVTTFKTRPRRSRACDETRYRRDPCHSSHNKLHLTEHFLRGFLQQVAAPKTQRCFQTRNFNRVGRQFLRFRSPSLSPNWIELCSLWAYYGEVQKEGHEKKQKEEQGWRARSSSV